MWEVSIHLDDGSSDVGSASVTWAASDGSIFTHSLRGDITSLDNLIRETIRKRDAWIAQVAADKIASQTVLDLLIAADQEVADGDN